MPLINTTSIHESHFPCSCIIDMPFLHLYILTNHLKYSFWFSFFIVMDNFPTFKKEEKFHQQQEFTQAPKRRKVVEKNVISVRIDTGVMPPADSWSWRKYGQKMIKGSPYPRCYYKCSTLKGCSAKKQVERCKTDAAVLIITYTSNHNHPGPEHLLQHHHSSNHVDHHEQDRTTNEISDSSRQLLMETVKSSEKIDGVADDSDIQQSDGGGEKDPQMVECFSPTAAVLPLKTCEEKSEEDDDDFYDELEELFDTTSSSSMAGLVRTCCSLFDDGLPLLL